MPISETIKTWLDTDQKLVLPRSPMAGAIGYMLNQWDALNIYTTQGLPQCREHVDLPERPAMVPLTKE